jgi:hypothetical protein
MNIAVGFDMERRVVAPAYNADVYNGIFTGDSAYDGTNSSLTEAGYDWTLYDNDIVEIMELAYIRGVKVMSTSWGVYPLGYENGGDTNDFFGDSSRNIEGYPLTRDGVSNPVSLIFSMAADHDMVVCNSAGNFVWDSTFPFYGVPSPGWGRMTPPTDARNIISSGLYDSSRNEPAKFDYGGETGVQNYSGFGITEDGRPQPQVTVPSQGWYDIYNPLGGYDYSQVEYGPPNPPEIWGGGTSGSSPLMAAGVLLLREARPDLNAFQIRECILATSSYGGVVDSSNSGGFGVPNFEAALAYVPEQDPSGNYLWAEPGTKYRDLSPTVSLSDIGFMSMRSVPEPKSIVSKRSWVFVKDEDSVDIVKAHLQTNGIKVLTTSKKLKALTIEVKDSQEARSVEAVINDHEHIKHTKPSLKYVCHRGDVFNFKK